MKTSEFSFYQFTQTIEKQCLYIPIKESTDIAFYAELDDINDSVDEIAIYSESGNKIALVTDDSVSFDKYFSIKIVEDLTKKLAPNDFFRLGITINGVINYSNLLRYMPLCDLSLIEYKCDADEFGFPFSVGRSASVRLPVRMHSPQLPQEEKIYTTLSGEKRVLFASINKEWQVETEYFDEQMHEKIIVALSCDSLFIDGVKVTKSDKYDIDWENYMTNECGEKIAKATFKVQQNKMIRNSNCG